ncbi:MAG: AAA family ATPase [Pelomonas sp.]|nr:AAA family ATPase [Roseateles sp.]
MAQRPDIAPFANAVSPPLPAAPPGQRRYLTLLFADLSGSTALSEALEAEDYAELLARLRHCYREIVARHGGTVVRIQGDGMLAIFGHPQPREDEGRHACEAALELHAAVRELRAGAAGRQRLSLHSGIHAGLVLVDAGDAVRGLFELLGQTPNIAARLSDLAGPDEILVSEETLGLHKHYFATGERLLLQLKGRSQPLAAYTVRARVALERRFDASVQRGLSPFVGRADELGRLRDALQDCLGGAPRWISLCAAAGIGKTRLIEEFLLRAAAGVCRVQRGHCSGDLSAEPLEPFLQILRTLERGADALPELEAARQCPAPARAAALLNLIEALARRAPLVLAIDDLHWADDASLALLHRLHDHALVQGLPLLMLTATRLQPHLKQIASAEREVLALRPFDEAEASAAVAQLLPQTDPFVLAEVQRHAGGNALYIEELCHALNRGAVAQAEGARGSAWLNGLIESRLARLAPEPARVLRAAAVIGPVVPLWLLAKLAGCGADAPAVAALADEDFLLPGLSPDELRFKHGITHGVVYEAIGLAERQAMHRRVGAELRARAAAGGPAASHELLAHHDGAAGAWSDAAVHAEAAGDQALEASALDRAKRQFRAAFTALEFLPDTEARRLHWIAIAQRFGLACVFDASRADLRVLRHAVGLAHGAGDDALSARADYWHGYVSYALGETRSGLGHCERGLVTAQRCGDVALIAQLRGTLGQLRAAAADYDEAVVLLDEAVAVQRRVPRRPGRLPVGLAYSLCCRAAVLGDRGEFAAADAVFAEALDLVTGTGHAVEASILGWRACVLLWQGRWHEAERTAELQHHVGGRVRSLFTFSMGHAMAAYAAWMDRRSPQALAQVRDATAWLAARGGGLYHSLNHGWLAELQAEAGATGLARGHVAQALRRGRQHDWIGGAMALRAAAGLAERAGDAAGTARYLALARRVAARRQARHEFAVTDLFEARLRHARGARADALLDAAETVFERLGMAWHLAQARALRY